jgi:HK97 gp10 family phage protein
MREHNKVYRQQMHGLDEAIELLKDLPEKAQKRVLIRVMRKATRPIVASAKANVSSGTVKRSIKAFEPRGSRRKENPVLLVAPKINPGSPDTNPWFAHFIEGGTDGVGEFGLGYKRAGSKSSRAAKNDIFRLINSNRKGFANYRKPQPAKPFMEPAIRQNMESVKKTMIDEVLQHINREASKMAKK